MPNTMKAASGLVAFVWNMGNPPPSTDSLSEERQKEVEGVMARIDGETPFVQHLLEKADPLFDLGRHPQPDNTELVKEIGQLQEELRWYVEHGRVRVFTDYDRVDKNRFSAYFVEQGLLNPRHERDFEDSWIVVEPISNKDISPQYWHLDIDPGTLMHEAAHNYSYHHYGLKKGHIMDLAETLKKRDSSYLLEHLYGLADEISQPETVNYGRDGARYPEHLFTELLRAVQAGNDYNDVDIIDEVALQKEISKRADAMLKQSQISREEWIDERVATFGAKTEGGEWTYDSRGVGHYVGTDNRLDALGMTDIGITIDEFRATLEESPGLFELRNQGFDKAFEDLEINFPDQYYEWKRQSERQKELAAEKKGGVKRR